MWDTALDGRGFRMNSHSVLAPTPHESDKAEAILGAALELFVDRGFHGTSVPSVAERAGVASGTIYHYFASKEAIIGAIASAGLEYTKARFAEITEDQDPIRTLVSEFERLKALNNMKSGVLLDVLAEAARNPEIGKILQDTSEAMRRLMAEFLRRGQAHGQIDPELDADMASAMLISLIDSSKTLLIRAPTLDAKRSADALDKIITRFLSPPVRASGS